MGSRHLANVPLSAANCKNQKKRPQKHEDSTIQITQTTQLPESGHLLDDLFNVRVPIWLNDRINYTQLLKQTAKNIS